MKKLRHCYSPYAGESILGGKDARCVIEISGERKKSLEILYKVMQWPVGHDQRAQSCTTVDPTHGSGRAGSGQKIYKCGRVGSGPHGSDGKILG